MDSLLVTYSW